MKDSLRVMADRFQDRQKELRAMVTLEKLKVARRQRRQELIGALIDSTTETASL